MAQNILVTGGNSGIGLALCKQLAIDHGCNVFMGSRNEERGRAAVESIELPADCAGSIQLVQIDVGDDASIAAAAAYVQESLGEEKLAAVVNNAGIGLAASAGPEEVLNTNLFGVKKVSEAMRPLVVDNGRIVNVGSGAGPMYVGKCPIEVQTLLCNPPESWEQIESWTSLSEDGLSGIGSNADSMGAYGLSKALVASYTMLQAKVHPELVWCCCTPGFIDTKIVAGFGATKPPEEGTVAIRHCLFQDLTGNGYYYGSDAVRSPLHFMRNPGEPEYDGVFPPA